MHNVIIFTDLDGTLLDHDTYSWEPARPALSRIRELGIPLVLVTSKTRAEVRPLRAAIGVPGDDIVENGSYSQSLAAVRAALTDAARETGVPVRAWGAMTVEEIAAAAGLPLEAAALAAQREYSEPFTILDEARAPELLGDLERRGLRWARGGRFHHVFERGGKGEAVRAYLERHPGARSIEPFSRARSIALGDAPNDIPMLEAVDEPVIVRSARTADLLSQLPRAAVTSSPGPAGWNEWLQARLA
ncbi:MAG: HAD hydrolase family protein [Bryobacteraceae bacterium]|nr:HAD hydrolase family protein [Bryobacteraceae bacterium]